MPPTLLLVSLSLGCAPEIGQLAPDFSLTDVNPASTTFDSDVSPRDKLDKASAWYFGHST